MSKSISMRNLFVMLLMVSFIVPGDNNRKAYIFLLFTILIFIERKLSIKKMFDIGWARWFYAITFIGALIINYYEWSLPMISFFIITFFVTRYIIIYGVNTTAGFENAINAVLIVFSIYAVLGIAEAFTQINIFDNVLGRTFELYGANNFRGIIYRGHGISSVSINNAMLVYMAWMLATYKIYNKRNITSIIEYILIGAHFILIFSRMLILVGLLSQVVVFLKVKQTTKIKAGFLIAIAICLSLLIPNDNNNIIDNIIQSFTPLIEEVLNWGESTSKINWGGTGERLVIWQWVFSSMNGHWLFGNGFETSFAYRYFYEGHYYIKQSIEVQWLFVLFQKGLFGLAGYIVYQIKSIRDCFNGLKKERSTKVSFSFVFTIMTLGYFVSLFACAGVEDVQFYYIYFALFEAYRNIERNGKLIEKV